MKQRKSRNLTPLMVVPEKVTELEDEPLSPMSLLFHKPDSNVYIVTIFGSNCHIDKDHIKSHLAEFVLSHPRLYSLQVVDEERGGILKWVQTEVNLDKHITSLDIDRSLITSSPEKFLEDYVYNLGQSEIDMSKPLWNVHILNGLKISNHTEAIGILRMHHSIGDGMSLMSLMLGLTRKISDNEPLLPLTKAEDKNSVTRNFDKKEATMSSVCMRKGFKNGCRLIWNTMVDVVYFLATILFLKDTKSPLTPPEDIGDTPKRIVHRTVSLVDIKLIARATKTTVNDVIMAVTEAGLSRYLNRRCGEELIYPLSNMRLRAAVFFNIRVLSGFHVVEEMKEKGSLARWGNEIGYVVYPLNVGIRKNSVEYVHAAKSCMDQKKASFESHFSYLFIKIILKLFGIKAIKFSRNMSLTFSNMMGPREEVSLFGYPVTYIATSCHGAPTGLLIHVISYVDKLTFALAVDERVVPDPHQLCDDLEESLNAIKRAAILAPQAEHGSI